MSDLVELWKEINGRAIAKCRECADHNGRCPRGHLCDPQLRAIENVRNMRARIEQLEAENALLAEIRAVDVLAIHAAISRRDWHSVEQSANRLRDKLDRPEIYSRAALAGKERT